MTAESCLDVDNSVATTSFIAERWSPFPASYIFASEATKLRLGRLRD